MTTPKKGQPPTKPAHAPPAGPPKLPVARDLHDAFPLLANSPSEETSAFLLTRPTERKNPAFPTEEGTLPMFRPTRAKVEPLQAVRVVLTKTSRGVVVRPAQGAPLGPGEVEAVVLAAHAGTDLVDFFE